MPTDIEQNHSDERHQSIVVCFGVVLGTTLHLRMFSFLVQKGGDTMRRVVFILPNSLI
jgi:hypothetical protein